MAEIPPDPDELVGDLPAPVVMHLLKAFEQWAATTDHAIVHLSGGRLLAEDAFRAGWWAGGAYLAHRIAGELGIAVVPAATEDGPDRSTGTGWPGPYGPVTEWPPMRQAGEEVMPATGD